MISFSPDVSVQTKINICLSEECRKEAFINCLYEVGKNVYFNDWGDNEDSEESDTCESVTEENEMEQSVLFMQ